MIDQQIDQTRYVLASFGSIIGPLMMIAWILSSTCYRLAQYIWRVFFRSSPADFTETVQAVESSPYICIHWLNLRSSHRITSNATPEVICVHTSNRTATKSSQPLYAWAHGIWHKPQKWLELRWWKSGGWVEGSDLGSSSEEGLVWPLVGSGKGL